MAETPTLSETSALAVVKEPRPEGYFPDSLEAGLRETDEFIRELMGESEELSIDEARELYPEIDESPIPIYKDSHLFEHFLGKRLDYFVLNKEKARATDPTLLNHPSFNDFAFSLAGEYAMRSTLELERTQAQYKRARIDKLTGVPNRLALFERLQEQQEKNIPTAVLMIDLDEFKKKNDTFGHAAGDLLLVQAAQRLSRAVRQAEVTMPGGTEKPSDLRNTDFVARFGGEEFAIVLSDVSTQEEVDEVCKRVVEEFNSTEFFLDSEKTLRVTASVGAAIHNEGDEFTTTIKTADDRLYQAKANGRNGFVSETNVIKH